MRSCVIIESMKGILFFLLISICILFPLAAEDYFVSTNGSDRNPGTREEPWQSLEAVQENMSRFQPGDRILFRRGDSFFGSLYITRSGSPEAPMTFGAYGEGPAPVLTGAVQLKEWEEEDAHHYSTRVPSAYLPAPGLILNGVFQPLGRYPAIDAEHSGYLTIESSRGKDTLESSKLGELENLKGCEAVIRSTYWTLDRAEVRRHRGRKITLNNTSYYDIQEDFGFFLQNHRNFISTHGEWYYEASDRRIGIYWDSEEKGPIGQASIEIPLKNHIVSIENQQHILIEDLHLYGSRKQSLRLVQGNNIEIRNCLIELSAETAIFADQQKHLLIQNCNIDQSQDRGMELRNLENCEFTGNRIDRTGDRPGMGQSTDDRYMGVFMEGNHLLFSQNRILNTGYVPLRFNGNHIRIENNRIDHYAFVKNDAGGIYCWSFGGEYTDRVITGNIISGAVGITDGTPLKNNRLVEGIYIDDRSNHVEISHNRVVDIPGNGIKLHNAHSVDIHHNLLAGNSRQIGFYRDRIIEDYDDYSIYDIEVKDNILLNTAPEQLFIRMHSIDDSFGQMARFDRNRYLSLFQQDAPVETRLDLTGSYQRIRFTEEQWKVKDPHSTWKDFGFAPHQRATPLEENRFINGTFDNQTAPWRTWSPHGNSHLEQLASQDKGVLRMHFDPLSTEGDSYGQLTGAIGKIEEGSSYLLSFDSKSAVPGIACDAVLRKHGPPYSNYAEPSIFLSTTEWTHHRIIITSTADENQARIDFTVPEIVGEIFFDNMEIMEVKMGDFDPAQYYALEINDSQQTKELELSGEYIDLEGNKVEGLQSLTPWSVGLWVRESK